MIRKGFVLAIALASIVGCGSSSNGGTSMGGSDAGAGGEGGSSGGTPASQWILSGTIRIPSGETAQALKVVVSTDENQNSASTYLGAAVAVTVSGDTGTFSLPVDGSKTSSPEVAATIVFDDKNGNGVNDLGEGVVLLSPTSGSPVFCTPSVCGPGADFQYIGAGTHGSGSSGSFSIDVSGWYVTPSCHDDSCAVLITTDHTDLSGVTLTYPTPIGK